MINLVLFKRDILFKKLRDYPFEQWFRRTIRFAKIFYFFKIADTF
jgi:hypothetical protein